jgi:hypothetical protein
MKTLKEQKAFIEKYILDCIDGEGYGVSPKTDREKIEFLIETFKREKSYEIDRIGISRAFTDWLQGLPSCFNIEFENYKILELMHDQGSLPHNATEKQEDAMLEKYWRYMTMRCFELYRKLTGIQLI